MAVDHALALSVREGEAVVRFYQWARPTVSFGRNEPALDLYSRERVEEVGVGTVRRPTGGRAVVHDRELTYAVGVPTRTLGGARVTYRAIHAGLRRGLRALGVPANLTGAPRGRSPSPDSGPCFAIPVEGEVAVAGRKLVGSAQVRIGQTLLQHGSVILAGDQELLGRVSLDLLGCVSLDPRGCVALDPRGSGDGYGGGEVPSGAAGTSTSLREVLGREPGIPELRDALFDGLREELGGEGWEEVRLERSVHDEATRLLARYASADWTWHRRSRDSKRETENERTGRERRHRG
jgi:lipoate-protein ligase A